MHPICDSVQDTLFITPEDEEGQGCEEDVFLDGLLPLSSSTSEASTIASTLREHAKYDLRGNRIGEADHLDASQEGERDDRAPWSTALPKSTNVADSLQCTESGLFPLLLGELDTQEGELVSRAMWALMTMHGEKSTCTQAIAAED